MTNEKIKNLLKGAKERQKIEKKIEAKQREVLLRRQSVETLVENYKKNYIKDE